MIWNDEAAVGRKAVAEDDVATALAVAPLAEIAECGHCFPTRNPRQRAQIAMSTTSWKGRHFRNQGTVLVLFDEHAELQRRTSGECEGSPMSIREQWACRSSARASCLSPEPDANWRRFCVDGPAARPLDWDGMRDPMSF